MLLRIIAYTYIDMRILKMNFRFHTKKCFEIQFLLLCTVVKVPYSRVEIHFEQSDFFYADFCIPPGKVILFHPQTTRALIKIPFYHFFFFFTLLIYKKEQQFENVIVV